MEFPVTTAILDKIRDLVSTLNAEERLALIQAIADMEPVAGETVPSPAQRHSQLVAEQAAWFALSPNERARYRAEFVAVHDGQVVDHDADRRTLYLRVRERFGHKPVLIVYADWTEPPVYTVHSPRLER
jgi:3-dehydroquinate synthase class II